MDKNRTPRKKEDATVSKENKTSERSLLDHKRKAVFLMLLSSLSFAFMAAMVKLSGDVPLFQKVFMRDLIVVIAAILLLKRKKVSPLGKKENRMHLLIRGISGFVGVVFYFYSASHLYLSDSTVLNKLSPFFTTLFAVFLLKEKTSKIQIPALLLSFLGGLLILKPQMALTLLPSLSGMIGAVVAGFSYAMVIHLTNREEPLVVVFYFSNTSVLFSFLFMLSQFQLPTLSQFFPLLFTGVFAAGGQIALTYSYQYAKASDISIYSYSVILFSGILGFFIWKEVPDIYSFFGASLIIFSGILMYLSYQQKKKRIL